MERSLVEERHRALASQEQDLRLRVMELERQRDELRDQLLATVGARQTCEWLLAEMDADAS